MIFFHWFDKCVLRLKRVKIYVNDVHRLPHKYVTSCHESSSDKFTFWSQCPMCEIGKLLLQAKYANKFILSFFTFNTTTHMNWKNVKDLFHVLPFLNEISCVYNLSPAAFVDPICKVEIFLEQRGCVIFTQQNFRKFEFFYCAPLKIQIFTNFAGW